MDEIKALGIDMLSAANNHCFYGEMKGLIHTLEVLDEYGFDHTGAYAENKE